MNRKMVFCALGGMVVLLGVREAGAVPYYVSDAGTLITTVDVDSSQGSVKLSNPSYSSGNLQQLSVSTSNFSTSVSGSLGGHAQSASGNISDTASIGALHSVVTSNTIVSAAQYGGYSNATANSDNTNGLTWSDTVTLFPGGPGGSDYTALLTLDDTVSNTYSNDDDFSVGARVAATIDLGGLGGVSHPTLAIVDSEYQHGTGPVNTPPPAFFEALTFHVSSIEQIVITGTLQIRATCLGGESTVVADASDTAKFQLTSSDPSAYYTTASGVTFTPEPGSLMLLGGGVLGLVMRRRGARA